MKTNNFTTTILVDETPEKVFNAVNNVRGWWSQEIKGDTNKLNAEFTYHYKDIHISKMKIIELVPGKRVVWLVIENYFDFTKDKSEWKGNKVIFEITKKGDKTQLQFTQDGLVPSYECYDVCHDAWTNYIKKSLHSLITTGKGQANPRGEESEFNEELIKKWSLQE
jgi:activator of Hsp90 ATPase-like protein